MGILWDSHRFSVGMGWIWGLKSNPHGSSDFYRRLVKSPVKIFVLILVFGAENNDL